MGGGGGGDTLSDAPRPVVETLGRPPSSANLGTLTRDSETPEQIAQTLRDAQDYEANLSQFEFEYTVLAKYRKIYSVALGALLWVLICATYLAVPIVLPVDWAPTGHAFGGCLVVLGSTILFVTVVSFIRAWSRSRAARLPNPLWFLVDYAEAILYAIHLILIGVSFIMEGSTLARVCIFLFVSTLCFVILARATLLRVSAAGWLVPVTLLAWAGAGVLTLSCRCSGSLSRDACYIFVGTTLLALAHGLAGVGIFVTGMRRLKDASEYTGLLPWGTDPATQFVQGIREPPFLFTQGTWAAAVGKQRRRKTNTVRPPQLRSPKPDPSSAMTQGSSSEERIQLLSDTEARPQSPKNVGARFSATHVQIIRAIQDGFVLGGVGCTIAGLGIISTGVYTIRYRCPCESTRTFALPHETHLLPESVFLEFVLGDWVIDTAASWWISVGLVVVGLVLTTQAMVGWLGTWMNHLTFGYLNVSNRIVVEDLRLPTADILQQPIEETDCVEARGVVKSFVDKGLSLFLNPVFDGCTPTAPLQPESQQ